MTITIDSYHKVNYYLYKTLFEYLNNCYLDVENEVDTQDFVNYFIDLMNYELPTLNSDTVKEMAVDFAELYNEQFNKGEIR